MSVFGALVATVGSISTLNNSSSDSNPEVFTITGAALSGLGFIIDLSSLAQSFNLIILIKATMKILKHTLLNNS